MRTYEDQFDQIREQMTFKGRLKLMKKCAAELNMIQKEDNDKYVSLIPGLREK